MLNLSELFRSVRLRKILGLSRFGQNRRNRPWPHVTQRLESLESRALLASNILASLTGTINNPGQSNELTMTVTHSGDPVQLGFSVRGTTGSSLNPAAVTLVNSLNQSIPAVFSQNNVNGTTESLVLAKVPGGSFKVFVTGEANTVGDFQVEVFVPGSQNGTGTVTTQDLQLINANILKNQFGLNFFTIRMLNEQGIDPYANLYRSELDADRNGVINQFDLDQATANINLAPTQITLIGDHTAPAITTGLLVDSGRSTSDRITNSLTITGTITDQSVITAFKAGFDGAPTSSFVSLLGDVVNGAFTLSQARLEQIKGGPLANNGPHTLHLIATDALGNTSAAPLNFTFTLDTIAPAAPTGLTLVSPTGNVPSLTNDNTPNIAGSAEANANVRLISSVNGNVGSGIVGGAFQLTTSTLTDGNHNITATATDIAGNTSVASSPLAITIDTVAPLPPQVFGLDPAFDTGALGDNITSTTVVELDGLRALGNTDVISARLVNTNTTVPINPVGGSFSFDDVSLPFGPTLFTLELIDAAGNKSTSTLTVTRNSVPSVISAPSVNVPVNEDATPTLITLTGVHFDDANLGEGDALTYSVVSNSNSSLVTAAIVGSGASQQLRLTYAGNANGTSNVVVRATDSLGASVSQTFAVVVTPVNDAPTTADQNLATNEDTALEIQLTANDGDPDVVQVVTFAITGGPSHGTISNFDASTGSFTYTPEANFHGSDKIVFTVTDDDTAGDPASLTSVAATVSLTVNSVNDSPFFILPNPISAGVSVNEDAAVSTFDLSQAFAADVDLPGDTLTFSIVSNSNAALVTPGLSGTSGAFINNLLSLTYAANANGTSSIVLKVTDSANESSQLTFTVTVNAVNDAPVANNQLVTLDEDTSASITLTGSDGDPEVTQGLTYAITSPPASGSITNFDPSTGTFVYTPAANVFGAVTIGFTVSDDATAGGAALTSSEATLMLVIQAVNDAPLNQLAGPQTIVEDVASLITNVDDSPLSIEDIDLPFGGADTVTLSVTGGVVSLLDPSSLQSISGNNSALMTLVGTPAEINAALLSLVFTPDANLNGAAAAQIVMTTVDQPTTGQPALSDTDTFTIHITAVNDRPTVSNLNLSTAEDTALNVQLTADDADPEVAQSLTFAITQGPAHGTISNFDAATGSFTYTPAENYFGPDEILVSVTDDDSAGGVARTSLDATITLSVTAVNDPAVNHLPATQTTLEDTTLSFSVANGNTITIEDVDIPDGGHEHVALFVTGGTVTIGDPSGLQGIAGNGTAIVRLTGNIDQLNAALATMTFTPTAQLNGDAAARIVVETEDHPTPGQPARTTVNTLVINITPVNDQPSFSLSSSLVEALEDSGAVSIADFLTNIVRGPADEAGQSVTVQVTNDTPDLFSQAPQINLVTGALTFTPAANANGSAIVSVVVQDNGGTDNGGVDTSITQVFTISITPVNDAPDFNLAQSSISTNEDLGGHLVVEFLTGLSAGPDNESGQSVSLSTTTQSFPANGLPLFTAEGAPAIDPVTGDLTYTLAPDAFGTALVTVVANDNSGTANGGVQTTTRSFTLTIDNVNDDPTAVDDSRTVGNQPVSNTIFVLSNDSIAPDINETLSITAVTQGSLGGSVAISVNGLAVHYTPALSLQGSEGVEEFTYTISDGNGGSSTATVTVTVVPNQNPIASDDSDTTDEDTLLSVAAPGVLVNDSDPEGSQLALLGVDQGSQFGATIDLLANGSFTYDPRTGAALQALNPGEELVDSFTYVIADGEGGMGTGTVFITVTGVNDAPVAQNDSATIDEDNLLVVGAAGVLDNDSDPDQGDALTLIATSGTTAKGASFAVNANGSYSYNPTVSATLHALVGGESTTDSFTYTIRDSLGLTSTATVTVTVTGVNHDPFLSNFLANADEDHVLTVAAPGLIGPLQASDPDGDTLSVDPASLTTTLGAQLTINADGSFSYDPTQAATIQNLAPGESLQETILFSINDGKGGQAQAFLQITVVGLNHAPVAEADEGGSTTEDDLLTVAAPGLLANDSDPDATDTLTAGLVDGEPSILSDLGATVTVNEDGSFTYDPRQSDAINALSEGETIVDTFNYVVTDNHGLSATATVAVALTGVNDNPLAGPASSTTDEQTATTGNLLNFVTDDDANDTLSIVPQSVTTARGSQFTLLADGSFTYNPSGSSQLNALSVGDSLTDEITYVARDNHGGEVTGTLTITVNGVNDNPLAASLSTNTNEDSVATGNVLTMVFDVDSNDTLSLVPQSATTANGGQITFLANGSFTYDPRPSSVFNSLNVGQQQNEVVTYVAQDNHGGQVTGTLTITVTGVNDSPFAANLSTNTTEDATVSGNLLSSITDPDLNEVLTFTPVSAATSQGGLFTLLANGDFTFDPRGNNAFNALQAGQSLNEQVTYVVTDSQGAAATATLTITVSGVNDAPVVSNRSGGTTSEDAVLNGAAPASLGTDPDTGDTLTISSASNTSTLGAAVVVQANGSFSYDPRNATALQALAVGESVNDTFTYVVSDSRGGFATVTTTITVTGANDAPVVANLIPNFNLTDGDPQPAVINLQGAGGIFRDPDTSDTLTFQVAGNSNTQLVTASISNGQLTLQYSPYSSTQDRSTANITIRATDPSNSQVTDTFSFTVSPQQTVQTQLVVRSVTGSGPSFTATLAAENEVGGSISTATGSAVFTLIKVNGADALEYHIQLNGIDLDGSQTATLTDNISGLHLHNAAVGVNGSVVFDILANASNTIDAVAGTIDGVWTTGFTNTLKNELLAQRLYINAHTNQVPGGAIRDQLLVTTLDSSLAQAVVGSDYFVEIWIQDTLAQGAIAGNVSSTGLTGASFDLLYNSSLATAGALDHGAVFKDIVTGTVDAANGLVSNFGGGTLTTGQNLGVAPAWQLLGSVRYTPTSAGTQTFALDLNADSSIARGGPNGIIGSVNSAQVGLSAEVSLTQVQPVTFTVNSGSSFVIVSGQAAGSELVPQLVNVSDRTSLSGSFSVVLDDLNNPTSVQILGSTLTLANSGNWKPQANGTGTINAVAAANLGFQADVFDAETGDPVGTLRAAFRNGVAQIVTADAVTLGDGGTIDPFLQTWTASGVVDRNTALPGNFIVNRGRDTFTNTTMVEVGSDPTTLTKVGSTYTLTFPYFKVMEIEIDASPVQLVMQGTIVATFTAPAPLVGTGITSQPRTAQGTNVFTTVVSDRTATHANGTVDALPQSITDLNEWDGYWVEVWANTSEEPGIASGAVDLHYNTRYYTPTQMEHGRVFTDNATGTIDDAAGIVRGFGGSTSNIHQGNSGFVLLGRVRFDALAHDDVPAVNAQGGFGPSSLGLSVQNAQLEIVNLGTPESLYVAPAPRAQVWPISYDVDNNDRVDFGDLSYFAQAFQTDVLTSSSPYAWALDFDKNGKVDFGDLSYFAQNFQKAQGDDTSIFFSDNYRQRWVGQNPDLVGSSTIDQVVQAANAAWQQSLGLDQPLELQVVIQDLGGSELGGGAILAVDPLGRPTQGRIILDDNAGGLGWYSSIDDTAFQALVGVDGTTSLVAQPGSSADGRYDLYTVVLHELGHAYGLMAANAAFTAHVQTTSTGTLQFVGPGFTATLDSDGQHLDDTAHPGDVLNDTLAPSVRKTISPLDVQILQTVYSTASTGTAGIIAGLTAPLTIAESSSDLAPVAALFTTAPVAPPATAPLNTALDAQAAPLPIYIGCDCASPSAAADSTSSLPAIADDLLSQGLRVVSTIDDTTPSETDDPAESLASDWTSDTSPITTRDDRDSLDEVFTDFATWLA